MDEALDPRAARLLQMLRAGEQPGAPIASVHERRESLRALADLAADPPPGDVEITHFEVAARDGAPLTLRRYKPLPRRGATCPTSTSSSSPGLVPGDQSTEASGASVAPRMPGTSPGKEAKGDRIVAGEEGSSLTADACSAAVLYLHGGGWVAGDLDTHAGVCGALAAASGAEVFALDYRRPPEHPFPGPIEDALDALAWLRREAAQLGLDENRLALAGDSAGANLAAACAPEAGPLACLLLICPILDLQRRDGSRDRFGEGYFISAERLAADASDYLGESSQDEPRVSPLRRTDFAGHPPTLIHAAACDPFRDEARDYAARLGDVGVPTRLTVHPGMIHYFYALPRAIPYAREALAAIGAELKLRLTTSRD